MTRMPTKAELRAARLTRIASSMRDFADPDATEASGLEEYDLSSKLWNLGDLFDDVVPPVDGPPDHSFHQPHPHREELKPIFQTRQDTRPPRGVKR